MRVLQSTPLFRCFHGDLRPRSPEKHAHLGLDRRERGARLASAALDARRAMGQAAQVLVLGLDPGFASCGYAVLRVDAGVARCVALGVVRTKKSAKRLRVLATDDNMRRAKEIARALRSLLEYGALDPTRKHGPARLVCAESMSSPRNSSSASKMAMTWGALIALCDERGLPLLQASPQQVKVRACGKSTASKEEVERAMRKQYAGLGKLVKHLPDGEHEHAFDALAVAHACLDSEEARLARAFSA